MPCRGSGRVISNLGGAPSEVTCPWCQGAGVRVAGLDAQAGWMAERARTESETEREPGAEREPEVQPGPRPEPESSEAVPQAES